MRLLTALILVLPQFALAGACCLGSGPRSFVQLRHLQTYDIGFATSFRDVFGRFDTYGEVVRSETNQTSTFALGASVRVFPRLEMYGILPFVLKTKSSSGSAYSKANVGDVIVGGRFPLYDPLFIDDPFPQVKLNMALKAPTGTEDVFTSDRTLRPGTGNGIWEPSLGVSLQKDYGIFIANLSTAYTMRFGKGVLDPNSQKMLDVKEGDRIELSETVTVPIDERWSVAGGSAQYWNLASQIDATAVADSEGRMVTGLLSGSYFVDRFWNVSLSVESVLPVTRLGRNEEAYRSVTLTSTYAIY